MRALVLGARGAVGRVVVEELAAAGGTVVPAGRTAPDGGVAVDLSVQHGFEALSRHAADVDVVVNASGVEAVRLAAHLPGTPLVEVSATSVFLEAVARSLPPSSSALLGAGLVPGLSTSMVAALESRPGDAVDVFVELGSGERHGGAAVEWTGRLLGTTVAHAPEPGPVHNLRTRRRSTHPGGGTRSYWRADFPDHWLVGAPRQLEVRTHLSLTSRAATAALAGLARAPVLGGALRWAPHWGSSRWRLHVVNRRTGQVLGASGTGQSRATGVLTALAARRLVGRPGPGALTMADVVSFTEAHEHLARRAAR